jgi:hypothetical protein
MQIIFIFFNINDQVADIVPVACKAADLAGVPSVCVTNFRYT